MLPEFGRGLHQQLNAVETPSGGGVVQSEGAIVAPLQCGHLRLPQQPTQHVQTSVSAVKQKEIVTEVEGEYWYFSRVRTKRG
jgi:hypothetical protein